MARRRSKVDLTLFPFLSVLAGLIAVLMLFMMVTLGTRAIEASDKAAPAAADAVEGGLSDEDYAQRDREVRRLEDALKRRLKEVAELRRQQDDLEALIELKKDEKALAERTGKRKGVRLGAAEEVKYKLIPAKGQAVTKKPTFVEVDKDGYLVHPGLARYPAVTRHEEGGRFVFRPAPALREFLEKVHKNGERQYLLFLLHPSGVTGYDYLQFYLRDARLKIDTGTEPFSRDWLLHVTE